MRRFMMLTLVMGGVASAAPIEMAHSGRLLGATGAPLQGELSVELSLWDAETGGAAPDWSDSFDVVLQDGFYSVVLGSDVVLDTEQHLAGPEVWLQVEAGGVTLGARQKLLSVPHAARASALDGGATVGGALVLGSEDSSWCTPANEGGLIYDAAVQGLRVCTATGWSVVGAIQIVSDGSTRRWSDGTTAISCREYRNPSVPYEFRGSDATDGLYWVDPDGAGVGAPLQVYCDQSTGPGGWQLMLAYSHAANVTTAANPNVVPTSPIGSYSHRYLGDMGYPSANVVTEARFYCTTSLHSRVLHFTTSNSITRTDLWDGVGTANVGAWTSNFTLLTGHTGNLPGGTDTSYSGGFRAMLDFPFYNGGDWHWAIDASDDRWECDDHQSGPQGQTLHQIWWR